MKKLTDGAAVRMVCRWSACAALFGAGALISQTVRADVIVGSGAPTKTTLGLATATNIRVESTGSGHGLILPYFNVQGDGATLLNIANTDHENGKLVKMRIRGAGNGDSLMSATILLAPNDMWTATLTRRPDGLLGLTTSDRSCTLPTLFQPEQPIMAGTNRLSPLYTGDALANQTREGTVEFITMADIPSTTLYGGNIGQQSDLFKAAKHVDGVPPCTVDALTQNFATEAEAAAIGMAGPTTGLTGRWVLINVGNTLSFSGNMNVVKAVDASGNNARANLVQFPQTGTAYPSGSVDRVTADPLFRTQAFTAKAQSGAATGPATSAPVVGAMNLDFPDFSTPYTVAPGPNAPLLQAAQFTQAMAVQSLANEFATDQSILFKTDWVLSMPARRFSLAMDYSGAQPRPLFSMVPPTGNQYFHDDNFRVASTDRSQACTRIMRERRFAEQPFDQWSREAIPNERSGFVITDPPEQPVLCGLAMVMSWKTDQSVFGATVAKRTVPMLLPAADGWAELPVHHGTGGLGLPILGSAYSSAVNPSVRPGVSGNFGVNAEHWYKR
jgi:hypothetical protein